MIVSAWLSSQQWFAAFRISQSDQEFVQLLELVTTQEQMVFVLYNPEVFYHPDVHKQGFAGFCTNCFVGICQK